MSEPGPAYPGACHCGDLRVRLYSATAPAALPVRLCSCGFCTRMNPRYTSAPHGRVVIEWQRAPRRYRFGHGTAEFLMCGRCGVFVAALWHHGDGDRAVINLLTLDARDEFVAEPRRMDFDGESPDERARRRAASWTPAELIDLSEE